MEKNGTYNAGFILFLLKSAERYLPRRIRWDAENALVWWGEAIYLLPVL